MVEELFAVALEGMVAAAAGYGFGERENPYFDDLVDAKRRGETSPIFLQRVEAWEDGWKRQIARLPAPPGDLVNSICSTRIILA